MQLVCDYPGLSLLSFSFYFRPTPAIEPEILRTMVVRHFIGYAPNPGNRKRNQVIFCVHLFIFLLVTERFSLMRDEYMNSPYCLSLIPFC